MQRIEIGQRVLVRQEPLRLVEEGVVEDLYHGVTGLQVVVRIDLAPDTPGEDHTVFRSVDADQVTPFEGAVRTERPAPPLERRTYRERLRASLERLAPELPGRPRVEAYAQGYLGQSRAAVTDFVVHARPGPVLIQTKDTGDRDVDEWTVELLIRMVANSHALTGVFVTNGTLRQEAERRLVAAGIPWVAWRDPGDDERLTTVLRAILSRPQRPATG